MQVACPASLSTEKRDLKTFPKTQSLPWSTELSGEKRVWSDTFQSLHIDKPTTKFHFGNIPWGRCILNNKKRLQIIGFFLALQKVLQHTRLVHRYCHFLESCRNQPNIWYHNNMVISITKTGLLWNFNPIYDKTIVLTIWIHSRFLAITPLPHRDLHRQMFKLNAWTTDTRSQREISLAVSSSKLLAHALKSYEARRLVYQLVTWENTWQGCSFSLVF